AVEPDDGGAAARGCAGGGDADRRGERARCAHGAGAAGAGAAGAGDGVWADLSSFTPLLCFIRQRACHPERRRREGSALEKKKQIPRYARDDNRGVTSTTGERRKKWTAVH